jgi:glycine C-acetyltransferase
MGSFSKTFGSNGGFVACNQRSVKEYLRYYSSPCTFSNALSPSQAAIVSKAFEIIGTEEGERLRTMLMTNIRLLRELLHGSGFETYGDPSPIVCVKMGTEGLARLVSRRLPDIGLLSNLVEFPAVPKGQARFRMQVMANHASRDIVDAVHRLGVARGDAVVQHEALLNGSAELSGLEAVLSDTPGRDAPNVADLRDKATAPAQAASDPGPLRLAANG